MVGKIASIGTLLLAIPTLAGPELPPHIYDIASFRCTVEGHSKQIHYADGSKPDEEVTEYWQHAYAKYKDGTEYPDYQKILSVRTDFRSAVDECVDWYQAVKRARERK